MTTKKPEVFEVYRTRQGTLENVVLLADYETLQAECERLRKAAETSAADANAAERECSKALRTLEGLERVAKVVSDNSDAVCGENNQLRVECERLRKAAEVSAADANAAERELETVKAECEKLRKDAERYRQLRDEKPTPHAAGLPGGLTKLYECSDCGHLYQSKISRCDCMPKTQKFNVWFAYPKSVSSSPSE